MDLLPAGARLAPRTLSVIGHGEFPRLLRQIERVGPEPAVAAPAPPPAQTPPLRSTGWSRPLHADHADLAALESTQRQAARARRRPGLPPEPHCAARFVDGVEVLQDGTELHLASFCLAEAEQRLGGTDDPAFAALKVKYADVLGGAPPGMPQDRGIELELETGDAPMPRSRPVKRLSNGELAQLRAQLIDLLDRGWIQHSTAGHAAAVVFARISRTGHGASATTTGASTPSRARQSSRSRTSTHCSTARGGPGSSPSSIWPAAISSYGCGPRIGGRRAFGRSWASASGTWCVWSAGAILPADPRHEPGPPRWSRL